MNIYRVLLVTVLAFIPVFGECASPQSWRGGMWNLDYAGDTSTYGYFRISLEPDSARGEGSVLLVQWVERLEGSSERVYATRLLPELERFIAPGLAKVEPSEEILSAFRLENARGESLWLRLWEPTRFELQKQLK